MGEVWGKNLTLYDRPIPATIRELLPIRYRIVAGDYFRALSVPVLKGRALTASDTAEAAPVAVVNIETVRRHWSGQDPIGKIIGVDSPRGSRTSAPWKCVESSWVRNQPSGSRKMHVRLCSRRPTRGQLRAGWVLA